MHDSRTWRQRTGVKTLSHPPTLLACFIIRAIFETVKVLVTHGRTQKTHGENIITETLTAVPNTLTQQRRCYHATGHLQQTDNRVDQYDVTDTRERPHKTCGHHCRATHAAPQ